MKLSIKATLLAVLAMLGLVILANGFVSWRALSVAQADLQEIYNGRVVPQRELKIIADAYAVSIVDASHKVRNGNVGWDEGLASVRKAQADIATAWKGFSTVPHPDPKEAAQIKAAYEALTKADKAVGDLITILAAKDAAALDQFVKERLYQSIDPVSGDISNLIDTGVGKAGGLYDHADAAADRAILLAELLLLVGAASIVLGVWSVLNRVVRPMAGLTATLEVLAREDFTPVVPFTDKHDEIGTMARAVDVLKQGGAEAQRLRADQERQRTEAERQKREALEAMAQKVEGETRAAVDRVAGRTGEMDTHAGAMAQSAELVSNNSQNVAAAAEQALHNAETVASAAEELSASIREISAQVAHSAEVSKLAVEKGNETQTTIATLSDAVARIGAVAGMIQEIAAQTNLLALNATIEAARAGEAGKGFAVVASEVKNLATQTARATEDIALQIAEINSVTSRSVDAVREIGRTIEEMDGISGAIAAAIEEQGAATQEISRNVLQAADAAREVAARIADVSNEAAATGDRAGTVRVTAADVAHSVTDLRSVLVRVVRTSMAEVDRRLTQRFKVDAVGTITIDGRRHEVTVRDLSNGGALLSPVAGISRSARGKLSVPSLSLEIGFQTLDTGEEGLHLLFTIQGDEQAALAQTLRRLGAAA
ncbi:MAG: methyl-accepting chemotaxis protein [Niveispirillum sp.]|uniref:methyl-accepting chemotaxis protein n=1 Tax=Niveispirillum sp. TaxID=1917217 RepID=UPI0040357377